MHVLFENLPIEQQQEIMWYLNANNFPAAKQLRDKYELEYLQNVENKDQLIASQLKIHNKDLYFANLD